MTCGNQYIPQLRARGFRMTPQRMAILHILHHAQGHISPTKVYERASRDLPGLTEATVYRTLEFLAQNGLACSSHKGNGHLVYEITEQNHHHLICRHCGVEMQVDHAALEKVYAELESSTGYRFINSHMTFFGLCPQCQNFN
jgi:Fur family ferric uptake transcriptional regulator